MAEGRNRAESSVKRLLYLEERYNLFHVKTLQYQDVHKLLEWLGLNRDNLTVSHDEDTLTLLNRVVQLHSLENVGVISLYEEPQLQGKDRLVVHIRDQCNPARKSIECDSIVLFLVIQRCVRAPYSQEVSKLMKDVKAKVLDRQSPLFPAFAGCPRQQVKPCTQQTRPVIDGYLPSCYNTTKPKKPAVTIDNFGRKYEPLKCTAAANPWSVYADIEMPSGSKCDFDVEELLTMPSKVLGRGGYGITVLLNKHLVAKTNLVPEMLNWSVPFIDNEFSRYTHIASQMEEAMVGVSMRHPNILRTFGAFWCEISGYQLGGRAVIVMERALFSLQEFMMCIESIAVVPAVEIDTLKGLDYLRSRAIQHRDLTPRNILVCHEPHRTPLPFSFKISDFGTSCNFSTKDQARGNLANMAPEILWCMIAATASDVFSWFNIIWELYSGSPLVQCKGPDQKYCKKTYAENLSALIGVYSPENDEAFELSHMKEINARALHAKHKDKRPTALSVLNDLRRMGREIADKGFVDMGILCITLFPQERWSPHQLLSLPRYQLLNKDISTIQPPSNPMPLSVQVGDYRPTDIIISNDCKSDELVKLVTDSAEVIKPDSKVYYGIDLIRLAPDLIQPYEWYSKKVQALKNLYTHRYRKRKACAAANPHKASAKGVRGQRNEASQPAVYCKPSSNSARDTNGDQQLGHTESVKDAQLLTSDVQVGPALEAFDGLRNKVTTRFKRINGEMNTMLVILKSHNENEIAHFKDTIVLLSQRLTKMHPLVFDGPREGLCKCSKSSGVFTFEFALFFVGGKRVSDWNVSESPSSARSFLLQVFLTMKEALDRNAFPTHMTGWEDMLIGQGAVIIDSVAYLIRNVNKHRTSMFGEQCNGLGSLCASIVSKHLPDSNLHRWLNTLSAETPGADVLTGSIAQLSDSALIARKTPCLLTLQGNCVTFKDFMSNTPNWLSSTGEEEEEEACNRIHAKMLVYGDPKPFRGNQRADGVGDTQLNTLLRNIVMRMKVKVFGSAKLEVALLDFTQGLTNVTVNTSALSGIESLDQLDRSILHNDCNFVFTHDVESYTHSRWAPVILVKRELKQEPVLDFAVEIYRMMVLLVRLSPQGSIRSLKELFQLAPKVITRDY